MADVSIPALPALTPVPSTAVLPLDNGTDTFKGTAADIVKGGGALLKDGTVAATANLDLGGHQYTNAADASSSTALTTLQQVTALVAASTSNIADWKQSVRVATTANITLSGPQTIDGVSVIAGDRVLAKNQTTASQNGIYVVAAGAWARSTDCDASAEVTTGLTVVVEEGTAGGGKPFILTTANPITLGTTALTFSALSSATAGNGLTGSGVLSVLPDGSTLSVSGLGVKVAAGGITATELASNAVTTAKILDGNVTAAKLAALSITDIPFVALATTGNVTLSGEQTIDGTLTSGSRVLVWKQTTPSQNGVYITGAGAWTRATDFDATADFRPGVFFLVGGGTANINKVATLLTTAAITVGTTAIGFALSSASPVDVTDDNKVAVASGGQVVYQLLKNANWSAVSGDRLDGSKVVPTFGAQDLTAAKGTFAPNVETTGSPYALRVTGAAHTTLTASTQAPDIDIALARTVQFATGALTAQRAVRVTAPTYGFVGASTITDAATVAISGAPAAGTNATLTRTYALWVESGLARFDGGISLGQTVSATGNIRGGTTLSISALTGGGVDASLIAWNSATPIITLGTANTAGIAGYIQLTASGISLKVSTSNGITIDSTTAQWQTNNSRWSFGPNVGSPAFTQETLGSSNVTGQTMLFSAQPVSGSSDIGGQGTFTGGDNSGVGGAGTAVGGTGVFRGGDSLGASGTRNGGDAYFRGGRGVTNDGNIALGADPADAVNFQGMHVGIFIRNAVAPTGNPSSGGFLYVQSGALKYLGSSGTPTTIAVA